MNVSPRRTVSRIFEVAFISEVFLFGFVCAIKRDLPSGKFVVLFSVALLMLIAMWLRALLSKITLEKDGLLVKQGVIGIKIKYESIISIENSRHGLKIQTRDSETRFYEIDKENFELIRSKIFSV